MATKKAKPVKRAAPSKAVKSSAKKATKKIVSKAAAEPAQQELPVTTAAETVEEVILRVTGEDPQAKGEKEQAYLERLADALDKLVNTKDKKEGDKNWNALTPEAQAWFSSAVEEVGAGRDFPSLPTEKAASPVKKEKAVKASPVKKEKAVKAAPAKKEKASPKKANGEKKKRTGGSGRVAALTAENLDAKLDVIMKKAKAEGITVADSQIQHVYAQTHRFAQVFRDAGVMKK